MAWTAPIAIPTPTFGIDETYRMYDTEGNRNPALTYNESPDAGYYTHYVDSTDPNSTDYGGNDYGSPETPRKTIPLNLPMGSVVEVHGSANVNKSNECQISGLGTVQYPIFVRGVDTPVITVRVTSGYNYNTQYLIVEGLKFAFGWIVCKYNGASAFDNSYICYRNCIAQGDGIVDHSGGRIAVGGNSGGYGNYVHNIVLYKCTCCDGGDWTAYDHDQDEGGFSVEAYAHHVWIVDSTAYHNSGCGIQILSPVENSSTDPDADSTPKNVYVGRCLFYENMQSAMWSKTARDVIFAYNIVWGQKVDTNYGCLNAGGGCQYNGKRIWFICNRFYENHHGFRTSSNNNSLRDELYMIGNLIYHCDGYTNMNVTHELVYDYGDGLQINGVYLVTDGVIMCFNLVHDCCCGINNDYHDSEMNSFNNIFSDCDHDRVGADSANIYHSMIRLNATGTPAETDADYDFYDSGPFRWNGPTYNDLAALVAATEEGDHSGEGDPLLTDPDNGDFSFDSESPVFDVSISPFAQDVWDRFYDLYGLDISCIENLFVDGTLYVPPEGGGGNGDIEMEATIAAAGSISGSLTVEGESAGGVIILPGVFKK